MVNEDYKFASGMFTGAGVGLFALVFSVFINGTYMIHQVMCFSVLMMTMAILFAILSKR